MAKKGFGKVLAVATVAGAAAAGISYLKKYRSFNDELEEEFHDFEGAEDSEDEDLEDLFEDEAETVTECALADTDEKEEAEEEKSAPTQKNGTRRYIALNASADELKLAAKDMLAAAGGMAGAARNVLKDAAAILTDTAHEAASAAKDTAQLAKAKVAEKVEEHRERKNVEEEDIFEDGPLVKAPAADGTGQAAEGQATGETPGREPEEAKTADSVQKAVPDPEKAPSPAAAQEAPSTTVVEELE